MRVHVITRDTKSDQILARLVRDLIDLPEWTFGSEPNPRAELNYYFPYLWYDGFTGTPTAAWFTHRDGDWKDKANVWDTVAQAVTLRLTSAQMYLDALSEYGVTKLVTTPLDRKKFVIVPRPKHKVKRIGTSGMVYQGGRKGETLIARLADKFSDTEWVASGEGWPIPTTHYKWKLMQEFYQGLDLYVCSSLVEGIGYGPLEAMACGVPVVIPRGVGVFDSLPDVQNLFRYDAGDFDSAACAIKLALAEPLNRESLRGITARFTRETWRDEHVRAIEDLLYCARPARNLPEWDGHAGVFYVAYGKPARECAERAIRSWHTYMPGTPAALVSDAPGCGEDVFVYNADEDIGARSVKTKIYDLAPAEWKYILYLDSDTEIVADVGFLFDLLVDGWQLVFCTNPAQYVIAKEMHRPDNERECKETFAGVGTNEFLQYNGGVFSFVRDEDTKAFFGRWHAEWLRYAKRDQAALDRALYAKPLRVYTLGNEWNTITRYIEAERTAGILHYPMEARRWKGLVNGRLDSSEAWAVVHPESKR